MGLMEQKQHFSVNLLDWYMINRRDLPWRRHNNPYFTWVSEIMLQQTRVDTVIPYFNRFIANFPTVQALAEAAEEDVLKNWEGLGYYSRARNLQAAAQQVMELHGGEMPQDKQAVFALKGVGPYTAGAILSIAFNQPQPAVDGNVMRVLSRYFLIDEDIMKGSTRVLMEELAGELIPEGRARDFNQALMELGALVCTPKAPHCLTCPVMEQCSGRIAGRELTLPVKTKAKPPRPEQRLVALVEGRGEHRGQVLVRQRPATGLLARMWELPHVLAAPAAAGKAAGPLADEPAMALLAGSLWAEGFAARPEGLATHAEHVFSHIVWNLQVYKFTEQDQGSEELPLIAAEARAAYDADAQAAAKEMAASMLDVSSSTADLVGESVTEAADTPYNSALSQTGKGDGLIYRWIGPKDMDKLAFPNVFLKLLSSYFAGAYDEVKE
ncbi:MULTISPECIES: A/G-specific adenine glycosylase [Paenibacillus]|uniref:Adenine DNA glycosylase n=1 Tax=Paenibacillus illinoisensis TaxID=59845 RepID=A0A2W0CH90_9BACL|nr:MULTISPECIES: A/G-specific adenine glycosylase [Paenibacillus]MBM6386081.1 A/G-specific adenine glycosylase [Paenibacillus sp.]PAD28152.1 A/G-specific adenine glycosylase [Paenibacillus sp. 7523-1]PYY31404.1 A-G-specific adenine glycosylase [Paenibacillus illinoisensis]